MPQTIQVGTILVKESPLMPELFSLEIERYSGNWNVVKTLDGFALDRKIRVAGWNFFFMGACRSKGDVFRCDWGEENPERVATNLGEGKTATLQRSRGHRNPHEAFSPCALYGRFSALAPYPTELLFG